MNSRDLKLYSYMKGKGGSSEMHNYSTTEQVIGTWIDGSPLYEKTIIWTWSDIHDGSASAGHTNGSFYTDYGTEIDTIWIEQGNSFLKYTGTYYSGVSITSQPLNYSTDSKYTRTNIQRKPTENDGKYYVYFDATYPTDITDDTSKWEWVITFRYTKSTP